MSNFVYITKSHTDNTYTCVIDDQDLDYQDIFAGFSVDYTPVDDSNTITGLIHDEPDMELYIDEYGQYFGVIN